jgi:hypothetical protein
MGGSGVGGMPPGGEPRFHRRGRGTHTGTGEVYTAHESGGRGGVVYPVGILCLRGIYGGSMWG